MSLPNRDDIVSFVVKEITNIGVCVELPEYNNIIAYVIMPHCRYQHINKFRIKINGIINKHFTPLGRTGRTRVISVCKLKGYIDLSYKI